MPISEPVPRRREPGKTMSAARGCKGQQPSKVNNGYRSFDRDLEGAGPSAPGSRGDNVLLPRLQGTAALQGQSRPSKFECAMDGFQSSILPLFHSSISCLSQTHVLRSGHKNAQGHTLSGLLDFG